MTVLQLEPEHPSPHGFEAPLLPQGLRGEGPFGKLPFGQC